MKQKTQKILFMNYMKAFGIIYLLLNHSATPYVSKYVSLFFLQMFFFISGYFYKDEYTLDPGRFFMKRLKSLYAPLVLYCTIFLVCNNLFVKLHIYDAHRHITHAQMARDFLKLFTLQLNKNLLMSGAMWFVSALFSTSILFCMVNRLINNLVKRNHEYVRTLSIVTIYMIGYYLSTKGIHNPSFLDIALVAVLFYYLGYLYHKYETRIPNNFFIALVSILTLSIAIQYGAIIMANRHYVNPLFLLACGVLGIYFNLYISKKLALKQPVKIINYIGNNTLVILALHLLMFKIASIILIYYKNLPISALSDFPIVTGTNTYWWWLYFLAGLIFPLTIKYYYEMVREKFTDN